MPRRHAPSRSALHAPSPFASLSPTPTSWGEVEGHLVHEQAVGKRLGDSLRLHHHVAEAGPRREEHAIQALLPAELRGLEHKLLVGAHAGLGGWWGGRGSDAEAAGESE